MRKPGRFCVMYWPRVVQRVVAKDDWGVGLCYTARSTAIRAAKRIVTRGRKMKAKVVDTRTNTVVRSFGRRPGSLLKP